MQWSIAEVVSVIALIYSVISPFIVWYAANKVAQYRLERAETDLKRLFDWKHEHCEPCVRYVDFLREMRKESNSQKRLGPEE